MIEEVSVVFHSAATIKFDEDLTKAVNLNVVAVFTLIEICKKMKKLQVAFLNDLSLCICTLLLFFSSHHSQVLVHVSTAYCNTQYKHISEEIYQTNGDPVAIIDLFKVSFILVHSSTDVPYDPENRPCCAEQSQDNCSDYWKQAKHLHIH
jgi:hypothetical protein